MTMTQFNVYPILTPADLTSSTNVVGSYSNGPTGNGVNGTITTAAITLTVDGVLVEDGDRLLLRGQSNTNENGLYIVRTIGVPVVTLERSSDFHNIEQLFAGQSITVSGGSTFSGSSYILTQPLPSRFGIDPLIFTNSGGSGGGTAANKDASDNAQPTVSSVVGATVLNHGLVAADTAGSLKDSGGVTALFGPIQSGFTGTAGEVIVKPSAAASGSIGFTPATIGTGDFDIRITSDNNFSANATFTIPNNGVTGTYFILGNSAIGNQKITSGGLQIDQGVLISGTAGSAGTVTSYPPTAVNGTLNLAATDAGGAFDTTISNSIMGQSTVYSMPDAGNSVARYLVAATATPFLNNEFPVASGTGGLMVSSGMAAINIQNKTNIVANRTADIGGAGAGPLSVVVAGLTAASIVTGNIQTSTNTVEISKMTATATGFDILFSGDPGASVFVNYIAFIVAQ